MFLAYASRKGHALIDRRLYLSQTWAEDSERRRTAKTPDAVPFLTKPEIAPGGKPFPEVRVDYHPVVVVG